MADRKTKILLFLIAAGLWANAVIPFVAAPSVSAQDMFVVERLLREISTSIDSIESDVGYIESDVDDIEDGTCLNDTICD